MGTRALVHIKESDKDSETLVTIYRQFDGYPDGLGAELLELTNGMEISNGITPDCFNGMGCLAAYLIAKLKKEVGNVYIYPPDAKNVNEEFTYTIYTSAQELRLRDTAPIYIDIESLDLLDYLDAINK